MGWDALNTMLVSEPSQISGLRNEEKEILAELFTIYNNHYNANMQKNKYYEGAVTLNDVNIGIAL